MSQDAQARPVAATDDAIATEYDNLSAAAKAAIDLHGARDIAAKTLNLASLTRPFDCACALAPPALLARAHAF